MRLANTYADVLRQACVVLEQAGCETPLLDARLLLQRASGFDHAGIVAHDDAPVPATILEAFNKFIQRRKAGEPVDRIIGTRFFHGLELELNRDVLSPRDDTECVIDLVLDHCRQQNWQDMPLRFADLGTGTGAVAFALLSEFPDADCVATDCSAAALEVARANAGKLSLDGRCNFCKGSWLEPLQGQFHAIVSNPPYIPTGDLDSLAPEVRHHDPRLALDGGTDGLDPYREILAGAGGLLKPGGAVVLEFGYNQAEGVCGIAGENGWDVIERRRDLAGHERAVLLRPKDDHLTG